MKAGEEARSDLQDEVAVGTHLSQKVFGAIDKPFAGGSHP